MDVSIDKAAIEKGIIREVADHLIDENHLYEQVRDEVSSRINKVFAERVDAVIQEAVDKAVIDGLDRAYQPVDAFGKPKGDKTTVRERLERIVAAYWGEMVDRHTGKKSEAYGGITRAEYTMLSICSDDFTKDLKQAAVNVTGVLKDGLRERLHGSTDKMLDSLFRVKSADDQGKKRPILGAPESSQAPA